MTDPREARRGRARIACVEPGCLGLLAALALLDGCTTDAITDAGSSFDAAPAHDAGHRPDAAGHLPDACALASCADAGSPIRDAAPDAPECVAVRAEPGEHIARPDIVWAILTESELDEETRQVEDNLRAFANLLGKVGVDYHLVVLATSGGENPFHVPAELVGDPRFRYVDVNVTSVAATWTSLPQYEDFLRPDGFTHIVYVGDDHSGRWVDITVLQADFEMYFGHHYAFHPIVSPPSSGSCIPPVEACASDSPNWREGCVGPYGKAAYNGDSYWVFSRWIGGLQFSICTENWPEIFAALSSRVRVPVPVPCLGTLPEPPEGTAFDAERVNVELTPGGSDRVITIPAVASDTDCNPHDDGWYYDDPAAPTAVVLCPFTCGRVTDDPDADLELALGCPTIPY